MYDVPMAINYVELDHIKDKDSAKEVVKWIKYLFKNQLSKQSQINNYGLNDLYKAYHSWLSNMMEYFDENECHSVHDWYLFSGDKLKQYEILTMKRAPLYVGSNKDKINQFKNQCEEIYDRIDNEKLYIYQLNENVLHLATKNNLVAYFKGALECISDRFDKRGYLP